MTKKKNFCRMLGLNPFKEDTYDIELISSIINSKERKWKEEGHDRQNDVSRRFRFHEDLDAIPEIKRVMGDETLRKKEFEDGRSLLKSKASMLKKDFVILHDGTPVRIPGAAESLIRKLRWEGVLAEDLVNLSGVREHDSEYSASKFVINAYRALNTVNAFTPVEMLNDLIRNKSLEIELPELNDNSSTEDIRKTFEKCEKRVNGVRPETLPQQDTYIQTMRAVKLTLSDDLLNELIEYGMCQRALIPIMDIIEEEYTQPQGRSYIDSIISTYFTNPHLDFNLAIRILEDFCISKKFIINFSDSDSQMIRCSSCNAFVDSDAEATRCSICGDSIRIVCPECTAIQSSTNRSCVKCGFDLISGYKKALESEEIIKKLLTEGLVDEALNELETLKNKYSTYASIKEIEHTINVSKERLFSNKRRIVQAYDLRRFSEAVEAIEKLLAHYEMFLKNDRDMENIYNDSIKRLREAEKLIKKAENSNDGGLNLYVTAAEMCPDHPRVSEVLSRYPPAPPVDISFKAGDGKILIKYSVPSNRDKIKFCIYRDSYSIPESGPTSLPIAEIDTGYFLDDSVEPGVPYYYTVKSRRWGVLSKDSTSCGPISVYSEVNNVNIEPLEDGLLISYTKPKNCIRVRIWRKREESHEEIELETESNIIEDRGLVGDSVYYYLFVTEYESSEGRIERSSGSIFSCATKELPNPVKDLNISWNKSDGTFTAQWTGENVILYSSPKSIKMQGLLIKQEDIDSWMTPLTLIEGKDEEVRFSLPDGTVQYIYPMIPIGKYAIRGQEVRVAELKPFRDVDWTVVGGECLVSVSWPKGAESAVIVITDSGKPAEGPNDLNGERITVSAEAYSKNKMIKIPMGNYSRRTVTMYVIYDIEEKKTVSRAMAFDVIAGTYRKIHYFVERSTNNVARVTMQTNSEVEFIPPIIAVCTLEGIPLNSKDGETIWKSEVPMLVKNGQCKFNIKTKLLDIEHMRIFFENSEDYAEFKFIHPLYGRNRDE
ncbi:MAG TPA: zinc ribbon domain-containing protein [Candidatus Methanomethylophilaceae archaeon]|nr:zinc ribbon domain-containing protein [Candidatus Methanomethylophilaceae archaeon]